MRMFVTPTACLLTCERRDADVTFELLNVQI